MSTAAVLLCSRSGLDADAVSEIPVTTVERLCARPAAAARVLRELGATRVVLGLCEPPSRDLLAALRRAGAEPFGIETVLLHDGAPAADLVVAAAAKLEALPSGERGRPRLVGAAVTRRAFLSRTGIVSHVPVALLDAAVCRGTASCGLCLEACPERAIVGSAALPTIDGGACSACAACVTACPAGALRLAGTSAAQVEAQLERLLPVVEGVLFACADADLVAPPPRWAAVEVPTLALVTPGWILQLRCRGVGVRLVSCDRCRSHAETVDAFAARLLAGPVRRPASARPVRLTEPAATVAALGALEAPPSGATIRGAASPLGLLSLDTGRCTLCGACANVCPTGALALAETGARTTVRHRPAACVACGRCVRACPEAALDVERGVDIDRLERGELDLLAASRETCRSCGDPLPPQALRRRLRRLLPALAAAPLDLCARCAASARPPADADESNTIDLATP